MCAAAAAAAAVLGLFPLKNECWFWYCIKFCWLLSKLLDLLAWLVWFKARLDVFLLDKDDGDIDSGDEDELLLDVEKVFFAAKLVWCFPIWFVFINQSKP